MIISFTEVGRLQWLSSMDTGSSIVQYVSWTGKRISHSLEKRSSGLYRARTVNANIPPPQLAKADENSRWCLEKNELPLKAGRISETKSTQDEKS